MKTGRKQYGRTESEREVIRRIRRYRNIHRGRRRSFYKIAQLLNSKGIPSPGGKKWSGTCVGNVLARHDNTKICKPRKKTSLEGDDYFDLAQAGKLFLYLKELLVSGTFRERRRAMVTMTLLCTGLRNFEIASLCLRDTSFWHQKSTLTVRRGKRTKGGSVKISQWFRDMLESYIDKVKTGHIRRNKTEPVFRSESGGVLSTDSIRGMVSGACSKADLPFGTPKTLRHSYASAHYFLFRDIRSTQKQLRHSNINTTTIYIDLLSAPGDGIFPTGAKEYLEAMKPESQKSLGEL